jgi:glucokinase
MADANAIGVDVGGTKILAGVVADDGTIVRRRERATPTGSADELLDALDDTVRELVDDTVSAVGFGVPGAIDQRRGRIVQAVNVPLVDVDLRDRMRDRLGLPVGLDNDANAAAIGEWKAGAARGTDDVVMLTLGTGVGGAVIANGRPFRGSAGGGAELGHVVVVHEGRPCRAPCTGRGHLEAYISGPAASAAAAGALGGHADANLLVRLADDGDATARSILAEIGRYLGSGLVSFANAFEPELFVVGGGFGLAAWSHLVPAAEDVLRRGALRPVRDVVRIVRAELGTAAGLVGAGFVGFEALASD